MPPIMGAAAFIMATLIGVPYATIALSAAIPAILYYTAVFIQVDLRAARTTYRVCHLKSYQDFAMFLKRIGLFVSRFWYLCTRSLSCGWKPRSPDWSAFWLRSYLASS